MLRSWEWPEDPNRKSSFQNDFFFFFGWGGGLRDMGPFIKNITRHISLKSYRGEIYFEGLF